MLISGDSSRPCSGLRTDDLFSTPHGAAVEAPEESYAPPRRQRQPERETSRGFSRDFGDDFAAALPSFDDDAPAARRRGAQNGYRLRLSGRALQVPIPKTTWGRIFSAIAFLVLASAAAAAYLAVRSFFLHDPRFTIATSASIQTTGNTHLSRAQLLSVFGEDVERNIFRIPLAQRRAELESLPWVEHATVMRLLPNHIRIAIVERTPVAFVRQATQMGSQIGLVDANGVLLDIPADSPGDAHYSFPVVTGINAADPLSTRAARMRIYGYFTSDLDSTGERISEKLSEVDLSNPEDVKALIPEVSGGITTDLLVHFGDSDFLPRYRKFESHLQEWLTDHPKLASVDMRYEHQVVLEMQPGATTDSAVAPPVAPAPRQPVLAVAKPGVSTSVKPLPKPILKAGAAPKAGLSVKSPATKAMVAARLPGIKPPVKPAAHPQPEQWHMVVVKPHSKEAAALLAQNAGQSGAKQRSTNSTQAAPR